MVSIDPAAQGSLTFFTGPMACGKTLELVRHLQIFREQQIPLICLRPELDTRTSMVQSRSGLLCDAYAVDIKDLDAVEQRMNDRQVIGMDEIEFFPVEIVTILERQLRLGKTLLLSGLDTDFRGQVFPAAHAIMAMPEADIQRLKAVCGVCHRYNATRTQRLREGQPVSINDPVVLIEGLQQGITYEARCLEHHKVV